jgi:ABC-type nitrate/sulfonate/bicarbonate transport system substrate-binding protein
MTNAILFGLVGVVALVLGGCTGGSATPPATVVPGPSATIAPPQNQTTYKIGASSGESSSFPVWLAIEHGIFQKYGITVEYTATGVGDTTVAALSSGDVSAAILGPSNLAGAVAGGSDLRAFSGSFPGLPYLLVTDPSINRIEDLRGKIVAIANPGGSASVAMEILLNQYGMKSGENVTPVNYGNPPVRLNSVKVGQAAATLVTGATLTQAENLKVLVDLRETDVPFQAAAIVMSEKFATANPQAAEAFVKGAWAGTRFLLDPNNKSTVVATIKKNLNLDDAAAVGAYTEAQKDFHKALPPRVSTEGVARILEVLGRDDPRLARIKAEDLIDNSIMDKLLKDGF